MITGPGDRVKCECAGTVVFEGIAGAPEECSPMPQPIPHHGRRPPHLRFPEIGNFKLRPNDRDSLKIRIFKWRPSLANAVDATCECNQRSLDQRYVLLTHQPREICCTWLKNKDPGQHSFPAFLPSFSSFLPSILVVNFLRVLPVHL